MATSTGAPTLVIRPSSVTAHSVPSTAGDLGEDGVIARHPSRHARFSGSRTEEYQEQRGRILTMKYGKHQMMLIRKRLKVEAWLMENLEDLYCADNSEIENDLNEFDIDRLLDIDTEESRRADLQMKLRACPADADKIQIFIEELIERLKSL